MMVLYFLECLSRATLVPYKVKSHLICVTNVQYCLLMIDNVTDRFVSTLLRFIENKV